MPKAARLNDTGGPHGCYPPSPIISGSSNVFINGIPAARVGDPLSPHGCSKCPSHPRTIASGSSTVFINGRPAARVGDAINCGGVIISGSANVIIGDNGNSGSSAGFFDTTVTVVKEFINEFARQASADFAESMADEAGTQFYDKKTGQALSVDEVKERYRNNAQGLLSIDKEEQSTANLVKKSMLAGTVISGISAYGQRKKIIARAISEPRQLKEDLGKILGSMKKNGNIKKKISEALGELGGLQAQHRLGIKKDTRFIKRYHGPDKVGYDRNGRLTELEFKGNNKNTTAVSRNKDKQKQGSSQSNLKRAKLMKRKISKVNKPSNRLGGSYLQSEIELWGDIFLNEGNKQHISVHTNTETGRVTTIARDNEGDIKSVIDEFDIEGFKEAKQAAEDYFKR